MVVVMVIVVVIGQGHGHLVMVMVMVNWSFSSYPHSVAIRVALCGTSSQQSHATIVHLMVPLQIKMKRVMKSCNLLLQ